MLHAAKAPAKTESWMRTKSCQLGKQCRNCSSGFCANHGCVRKYCGLVPLGPRGIKAMFSPWPEGLGLLNMLLNSPNWV